MVLDINQQRIDAWNSDKLPIFEPGQLSSAAFNGFLPASALRRVATGGPAIVFLRQPERKGARQTAPWLQTRPLCPPQVCKRSSRRRADATFSSAQKSGST